MTEILNFIKDNDLEVILLIGLIAGLLYLMNKLIKAAIAKDLEDFKHENSTKIKKLESELDNHKQQLEQMHQISQTTYQNLFEKKIDVYQKLLKIITKYKKELIHERRRQKVLNDNKDIFFKIYEKFFKDIINYSENKTLFMSNDLSDSYKKLKEKENSYAENQIKLKEEINILEPEHHLEDQQKIMQEISKINAQLFDESKLEVQNFSKILKIDIQKIKDKINLD